MASVGGVSEEFVGLGGAKNTLINMDVILNRPQTPFALIASCLFGLFETRIVCCKALQTR